MAKPAIAIAILHGIGIHDEAKDKEPVTIDWRHPKQAFEVLLDSGTVLRGPSEAIENMTKAIETAYTTRGGTRKLVFKTIFWGTELQVMKEHLWDTVKNAELGQPLIRQLLIYMLGDIMAYQPTQQVGSMYSEIHKNVQAGLKFLADEAGPKADLCVIAHSLGSIIASDFFSSLQQGKGVSGELSPLENGKTFKWLYTLGSPLAMYSLRYQASVGKDGAPKDIPFGMPIKVPTWKNIYYKADLIGYPLSGLNELYKACGVQDVVVEAGNLLTKWNALSHMKYWETPEVVNLIVEGLLNAK